MLVYCRVGVLTCWCIFVLVYCSVGVFVVSCLDMYHTNVLMYHTMVLLACPMKGQMLDM